MPRRVRVVVPAGALPWFEVESPWWADVEPVVSEVRARFGADVHVLRLLDVVGGSVPAGGDVTYLAEPVSPLPSSLPLEPVDVVPAGDDDPLRASWARPGGVADAVAWADSVLAAVGRRRVGPAEQVKTWNLSMVLRLRTDDGVVWCKSVPPFLAHEGEAIALVAGVAPGLVPTLLGTDRSAGRVLLADVPGDDQWDAPPEVLVTMVESLVGLQATFAERLPAGLPDWRAPALTASLEALVARPDVRAELAAADLDAADALLAGLPERFAALAECGLPETLVHGDFHPGNWRSDGRSLVLLDWGDSGVGHPLLDATAFLPRIADAARPTVEGAWASTWQRARRGSDPGRALELVWPVAALRQALVYRTFLDGIEASERRYHEADVADWIRRAAGRRSTAPS